MIVFKNVRYMYSSLLWPIFGYHRRTLILFSSQWYTTIVGRSLLPVSHLAQFVRFDSQTSTNAATVGAPKNDPLSQAECIVAVGKFLGLGLGKTKTLFKKFPDYAITPISTLEERHGRLIQQGVSEDRLKKLPHLLLQDTDKLKEIVSKAVEKFGISAKAAYAFAHLNVLELETVKIAWARDTLIFRKCGYSKKYRNRLHFFRDRLKCSEIEAADMVKAANLFTVPLERLCSTTELLLGAGVEGDHIRQDPWIFCLSSLEKVKIRLSTLQSNHVHPIKPWMLRCDDSEFRIYVENDVDEQNLMRGKADLGEFLASALQCSLGDANNIIRKESGLKLLKVRTIYDKIQFLLSKGYTKEEFIAHPRILIHNLDKTEARYQSLSKTGHRPSLKVLGQSQRKYSAFLYKFLDTENEKVATQFNDGLRLDQFY